MKQIKQIKFHSKVIYSYKLNHRTGPHLELICLQAGEYVINKNKWVSSHSWVQLSFWKPGSCLVYYYFFYHLL